MLPTRNYKEPEIENDWDLGPSVMKFDGTNWVNVGNEGFSDGAQYLSLAISPSDNEPYVSFEETGLLYENASVMKFNGTNWVYVGNEGFSLGVARLYKPCFQSSMADNYYVLMWIMEDILPKI